MVKVSGLFPTFSVEWELPVVPNKCIEADVVLPTLNLDYCPPDIATHLRIPCGVVCPPFIFE
jgi:hypothetical protein